MLWLVYIYHNNPKFSDRLGEQRRLSRLLTPEAENIKILRKVIRLVF